MTSTMPKVGWHEALISTVRPGEIACLACGVSTVPGEDAVTTPILANSDPKRIIGQRVVGRCGPCSERFRAWEPWAAAHPHLMGVSDPDLATVFAESLACAAELLGFTGTPGPDVLHAAGLMPHPYEAAGWRLRWQDYAASNGLESGRCASVPWGFVSTDLVRDLRQCSADALAAQAGTPRMIPANDAEILASYGDDVIGSGCYCCGVPTVPAPFPGAQASDVWTPLDASAYGFPPSVHQGRAAGRVLGVVCPTCNAHVEAGNGVGDMLAESLLGGFYNLAEGDTLPEGRALLWAAHTVRARRLGAPEPVSAGPWQHLPRDKNGELVRPRTAPEYVVPTLPPLPPMTGADVLHARMQRMSAEEAGALLDRLTAEPEPVVAAVEPDPPAQRWHVSPEGWMRF